MEAIIMSAGIMTTIILSLVGIVKLPFGKFKEKHPKGYKAIFTALSIVLTLAACLINQAFILSLPIFTTSFAIMLLSTFAGVFGLYHSYEGLGLKELMKRLVNAIKEAMAKAKEVKASATDVKLSKNIKSLEKDIDKVGLDLALEIIKIKQSNITQVVENQTINADKVEIKEVQNSTINTQN